jgi:O-antigen ligase
LILLYPIAVAGQNIGAGVVVLLMLPHLFTQGRPGIAIGRFMYLRTPFFLTILFTISILASTAFNTVLPAAEPWRYIASQLIWVLLPVLIAALGPLSPKQWQILTTVMLFVCIFFGMLALSQRFFPWQVKGTQFVAGTMRARGFYSHPLTFAYSVFLLWPLALGNLLHNRKSVLSWLGFLGIGTALILSESRTILLAAGCVFAYNLLVKSRGSMRLVMGAIGISAALLVVFTENPFGEKIRSTISAEGFDRNTEYPDDRVAFWHAHLKMVEEKPVFGHGIDLAPAYLAPYYAAIGLGDFTKKYPAHNTFLQVLVNAGGVGLAIFLVWYIAVAKVAWKGRNDCWANDVFLQTWVSLAVVSMTQNAFQDSEVRYGMALAVGAIWLGAIQPAKGPRKNNLSN